MPKPRGKFKTIGPLEDGMVEGGVRAKGSGVRAKGSGVQGVAANIQSCGYEVGLVW